jgi:hypothetical protein
MSYQPTFEPTEVVDTVLVDFPGDVHQANNPITKHCTTTTVPRTRVITISFYTSSAEFPARDWKTMLGSVVSGKYIHVTLTFDDGMTTSICRDDVVYFAKRAPRIQATAFRVVMVTEEQNTLMREFVEGCASDKVPFNSVGFEWCWVPCMYRKCDDSKYFCSEYIVRILQFIPRLRIDADAGSFTPTAVYAAVCMESIAAVGVVTCSTDFIDGYKLLAETKAEKRANYLCGPCEVYRKGVEYQPPATPLTTSDVASGALVVALAWLEIKGQTSQY